jgi:hypothetical protein
MITADVARQLAQEAAKKKEEDELWQAALNFISEKIELHSKKGEYGLVFGYAVDRKLASYALPGFNPLVSEKRIAFAAVLEEAKYRTDYHSACYLGREGLEVKWDLPLYKECECECFDDE